MAVQYLGHYWFEADRDLDGHRTYKLRCKVASSLGTGPAEVMRCPGLPQPGMYWLVGGDVDVWAYCTQETTVKPHPQTREGNKPKTWVTEHTFTTKPRKKCSEQQVEDPLLEPQKVSGGSVTKKTLAEKDRAGDPITYSSGEKVLGPAVEFDKADSRITVRQNVANLEGFLVESMLHTVNDAPLWGYPARWVKFSSWTWEKNYHGLCSVYYTRVLEFEVSDEWDRELLDESNKCVRGDWDRDPESPTYKRWVIDESVLADYEEAVASNDFRIVADKPSNMVRYKDWWAENSKTILNGYGRPYRFPEDGEPVYPDDSGAEDDTQRGEVVVEYYPESNLLLLGIPVTI